MPSFASGHDAEIPTTSHGIQRSWGHVTHVPYQSVLCMSVNILHSFHAIVWSLDYVQYNPIKASIKLYTH